MAGNIIESNEDASGYRAPVWGMPEVHLGQTVLWSYGPGQEAAPATVTKVGYRSINVLVHVENLKDHLIKTGVRHESDPVLKTRPEHDAGVWRHSEFNTRIIKLLTNFEEE